MQHHVASERTPPQQLRRCLSCLLSASLSSQMLFDDAVWDLELPSFSYNSLHIRFLHVTVVSACSQSTRIG